MRSKLGVCTSIFLYYFSFHLYQDKILTTPCQLLAIVTYYENFELINTAQGDMHIIILPRKFEMPTYSHDQLLLGDEP